MAIFSIKKASKPVSIQEQERIEGFSNEPYYIDNGTLYDDDFDSILIRQDLTTFAAITAYEADGTTYDYLEQINRLTTDEFDKDEVLTSPNGFASINCSAGAVRIHR